MEKNIQEVVDEEIPLVVDFSTIGMDIVAQRYI